MFLRSKRKKALSNSLKVYRMYFNKRVHRDFDKYVKFDILKKISFWYFWQKILRKVAFFDQRGRRIVVPSIKGDSKPIILQQSCFSSMNWSWESYILIMVGLVGLINKVTQWVVVNVVDDHRNFSFVYAQLFNICRELRIGIYRKVAITIIVSSCAHIDGGEQRVLQQLDELLASRVLQKELVHRISVAQTRGSAHWRRLSLK